MAISDINNKNVYWAAVALVAGLVLFSRVNTFLPHFGIASVNPSTYLFGTFAASAVIVISRFWYVSSFFTALLWVAIYLLVMPFFAGEYTVEYLFSTIIAVEAAMVAVMVILANNFVHKLNSVLHDLHVERETAEPRTVFPLLEEAIEDIKYEIIRARRYDHPISILIIQAFSSSLGANGNIIVANTLRNAFRRTERLYVMDKFGRFLIFCPETTMSSMEMLVNRIQILTQRELGIHTSYGMASFPDQELTFEGLVARAEKNLSSGTKPQFTTIREVADDKLAANNAS
jgi:hypothetical protein